MNDVKLAGQFEGSRDNQGGAKYEPSKYSNNHVIMKLIILYRFFKQFFKDTHKKKLIL